MTSEQDIHEAIAHARHVADSLDEWSECRAWHLQLAEWLEELVEARVELVRLRGERDELVARHGELAMRALEARAEVERLREVVDRTRPARTLQAIMDFVTEPMECGHDIDCWDDEREVCVWCEAERLRGERTAVVAWLRTQEALDLATYYGDDGSVTYGLGGVADAIERGDHLEADNG